MFAFHKRAGDVAAPALQYKSAQSLATAGGRQKANLGEGEGLPLKTQPTCGKVRRCDAVRSGYQVSELSQLEPGEGTSVSLARAQECAGDWSRSMFPRRRVSRAAGEWVAGWPLWLSSSCTRKLM